MEEQETECGAYIVIDNDFTVTEWKTCEKFKEMLEFCEHDGSNWYDALVDIAIWLMKRM